jgi:hypothetical protein
MKRQTFDGALERQFLSAMVNSTPFLAGAAGMLAGSESLWPQPYAARVSQWCLDHWRTYRQAPANGIIATYRAWAAAGQAPEGEAEAVGDFLVLLAESNGDATVTNPKHLLDEFASYLTLRKGALTRDSLTTALDAGSKDGVLAAMQQFSAVTNDPIGYHSLCNKPRIESTYVEPPANLFELPGAANSFFSRILTRDALVAFQGPKKRGKSQWLLEIVVRALMARRKVAVFQVGDLTQPQIDTRFDMRISGLPIDYDDVKNGIEWPVAMGLSHPDLGERRTASISTTTKFPAHVVSADPIAIYKAHKRFCRGCGLPYDKPYDKWSVHANSSISVSGIHAIKERWRHEEGWVSDVDVIDYADILAPEPGMKQDFRHQENEKWKALRRLSQEWRSLVVTATQSNVAGDNAWVQTMGNFSEDNRKFAHVTAAIGINETENEKAQGVQRLNIFSRREGRYSVSKCLWVAGCFPLAQALVLSEW